MSEDQKEYDLGIDKLELTLEDRAKIYYFLHPTWAIANWEHSFFDMHNISKFHGEPLTVKPFNPSQFGAMDGSFNGTIYRSFNEKFTFKESNGVWVILKHDKIKAQINMGEQGIKSYLADKMPEIVFRGKIESNAFAEKLFKSFEVKE